VINLVRPVGGGPKMGSPQWWGSVERVDAVAERKGKGTPKARLEDRIFFGKPAAMLKFESVFEDFRSHWEAAKPPNGEDPCPEWLLWRYLLLDKSTGRETRPFATAKVPNFLTFDHFKSADEKYQASYRDALLREMGKNGTEVGGLRGCSEFTTAWAKVGCEASRSSSSSSSSSEDVTRSHARKRTTRAQLTQPPPPSPPEPAAAAAAGTKATPRVRRVCSTSSPSATALPPGTKVPCWDEVDASAVGPELQQHEGTAQTVESFGASTQEGGDKGGRHGDGEGETNSGSDGTADGSDVSDLGAVRSRPRQRGRRGKGGRPRRSSAHAGQ